MLKPKKEIFKKEIKRDPFLETVDKIEASIEKNSKDYLKIFGGIVLFVIIISFLINSRNINKEIVSSSIGNALVALDKGDVDKAKFQFETLLDDNSGSAGIEVVHYYLGKISYERGDYKVAKEYLDTFLNSGFSVDLLTYGSTVMVSDILLKSENYLEALNIISEKINKSNDNYLKQRLIIEKAKLLIESGENVSGIALLNELNQSENISSGLKSDVEEIIGKYQI